MYSTLKSRKEPSEADNRCFSTLGKIKYVAKILGELHYVKDGLRALRLIPQDVLSVTAESLCY